MQKGKEILMYYVPKYHLDNNKYNTNVIYQDKGKKNNT